MTAISPNPLQPIVDRAGKMSQTFRTWAQAVTATQILIGTGSPETVVSAAQGRLYMDDSGTAGSILYVKRDDNIGGDTSKGWILV